MEEEAKHAEEAELDRFYLFRPAVVSGQCGRPQGFRRADARRFHGQAE